MYLLSVYCSDKLSTNWHIYINSLTCLNIFNYNTCGDFRQGKNLIYKLKEEEDMNYGESGLSASDVALLTNDRNSNNGGFGNGNECWWIISN